MTLRRPGRGTSSTASDGAPGSRSASSPSATRLHEVVDEDTSSVGRHARGRGARRVSAASTVLERLRIGNGDRVEPGGRLAVALGEAVARAHRSRIAWSSASPLSRRPVGVTSGRPPVGADHVRRRARGEDRAPARQRRTPAARLADVRDEADLACDGLLERDDDRVLAVERRQADRLVVPRQQVRRHRPEGEARSEGAGGRPTRPPARGSRARPARRRAGSPQARSTRTEQTRCTVLFGHPELARASSASVQGRPRGRAASSTRSVVCTPVELGRSRVSRPHRPDARR